MARRRRIIKGEFYLHVVMRAVIHLDEKVKKLEKRVEFLENYRDGNYTRKKGY